jgi:hypothetical protein
MRRRSAWGSLLGVLVAATACGEHAVDDASEPERNGVGESEAATQAEGEIGPICAECQAQPQQGGETNDFEGPNGEDPVCATFASVETITLDEAATRGFDIDALRALVERDFDTSFTWQKNPEPLPSDVSWDGGGAPSGYLEQTSLHGSVRLAGSVEHTAYDPARCDFERGRCAEPRGFSAYECFMDPRGMLTVPIDVELSTQDGALSLTAATFARPLPSSRMRASFWIDLALLQGKLRFDPQLTEPYQGSVQVKVFFHDDGVRGTLVPSVWAARYHRPLVGHWPSDDCGVDELPITAGSAESATAEQWLRDEYAVSGVRELQTQWSGHPAPRDATGGREPALTLEPSLDAVPRCASDDGALVFDSDVRLVTSDGFLDWSTPVRARRIPTGSDTPPVVTLQARHDLPSDAALWSAFPAFRFFGATLARADLTGSFTPGAPESPTSVALRVSAVPACSDDRRCSADTGDECEWCGQPDELLRLTTPPAP